MVVWLVYDMYSDHFAQLSFWDALEDLIRSSSPSMAMKNVTHFERGVSDFQCKAWSFVTVLILVPNPAVAFTASVTFINWPGFILWTIL